MLAQNTGHGVNATDLSIALYGNAEHTVAVRSEISRLRKRLGAIITGQPYRFSDQVAVRVLTGLDPAEIIHIAAKSFQALPGRVRGLIGAGSAA